jgi:hypothetical protein
MTRDDVMRLLMIQADRKRPIAEILVGQGVLTELQLDDELLAYRRSQINPRRATTTTLVPAPRSMDVERSAIPAAAV